jgi:hypothetical protein
MKTIQLLCVAAGIAATLSTAALAEDAPNGPSGPRGPRGAGPRRQGPPPELVAKYDVNHDGKLDETERAALHADIQSGKITPPEGRGPRDGRRPEGRKAHNQE